MAKKRAKKVVNKEIKKEKCRLYDGHRSELCLVKLTAIAFILFLMTVWKALGVSLMGVHWGIYLGITVLLMVVLMAKKCKKK